jgi:hypothetical protein
MPLNSNVTEIIMKKISVFTTFIIAAVNTIICVACICVQPFMLRLVRNELNNCTTPKNLLIRNHNKESEITAIENSFLMLLIMRFNANFLILFVSDDEFADFLDIRIILYIINVFQISVEKKNIIQNISKISVASCA